MAVIRDPAFWKRFSLAVHLDEEKGTVSDSRSTSPAASRPGLKHTDTWLERNRKKQRQTRILGWIITLSFLIVIAAIVLIILWLLKVAPFKERSD